MMVEFVAPIARYQLNHRRYFIIENPHTSRIWCLHCAQQLFSDPFYAYGLKDPESGLRSLKPTSLMHCLPSKVMRPIFRKCKNFTSSVRHEHQPLEGNAGTLTHVPKGRDALSILAFTRDNDYNIRITEERTALSEHTLQTSYWIMKKNLDQDDREQCGSKIHRSLQSSFLSTLTRAFPTTSATSTNLSKNNPARPRKEDTRQIKMKKA